MGKNLTLKTISMILSLAGISMVGLGRPADATDIPYSMFNTGVSSVGNYNPGVGGVGTETHYTLFSQPAGQFSTIFSNANQTPNCKTVGGSCKDQSIWDQIFSLNLSSSPITSLPGTYIFETTFNIPAGQTIKYLAGQWLASQAGVSVTLNPTISGSTISGGTTIASTPGSSLPFSSFQFNNGIVSGTNTLFFTVSSSGSSTVGLQVQNLHHAVPFEFDAKEGFLMGIPLFIGLRWLKKKRASV